MGPSDCGTLMTAVQLAIVEEQKELQFVEDVFYNFNTTRHDTTPTTVGALLSASLSGCGGPSGACGVVYSTNSS